MEVRLDDIIVSKTGNSNGGENCNLYGQNAALLVKDGSVVTISDAQVVSSARGSSGLFSYGGSFTGDGDGTRLDISNSSVTTNGINSGGIAVSGGGIIYSDNLTVNTTGQASSPVRSDIGGGTINIKSGTYASSGKDSPAVYSMADISIKDSTLIAHRSPGAVVVGKNSLNIESSVIAGYTTQDIESDNLSDILLYDPGNSPGKATLSVKSSTITDSVGQILRVTNTDAKVSFEDVTINTDAEDTLISICNDDKWRGSENKASVEFRSMQALGDIVVDNSAVGASQEKSSLDLVLANGAIYTGSINSDLSEDNRGEVNLTVRQGGKFVLSDTSYITSLVNNGRIECGEYDLYVNGEKYDDGGSSHPTQSYLALDGTIYTIEDRYGRISVDQNKDSLAITATIKKSGEFVISGSCVNTSIRVAKNVKDAVIILDNLVIDNRNYAQVTGTDASVFLFEPEASGTVLLRGDCQFIGSSTYQSSPKPIFRGTESEITFGGLGKLTLTDSMTAQESKLLSEYCDCISNYKGVTTLAGGIFKCRTNGNAINAASGLVNIQGAIFNVEYSGKDAINVNDGIFSMTSGRLDVSEANGMGISASLIESTSRGTVMISGGEVRLYKIAECGIKGEDVVISGGQVDITTIYSHSADQIYVPGNGVINKITVFPVEATWKKTVVNYNPGSHHGIEAGRQGKSYSYLNVPKTDTEHEVGVTYTQAASGSVSITGGIVNIDTKVTGLVSNILIEPDDFKPCSDDIYRVGAPGNGIMSYGTVAISGGSLTINAGGNGIDCDGATVINQAATVNIPSAYVGIRASDLIIGTEHTDSAQVSINSSDTEIIVAKYDYTYVYEDSREEHNHYTLDTVELIEGGNFYTYGGTIVTLVDIDKFLTVTLRSGSGSAYDKKEFTYKNLGRNIRTVGFLHVYGGTLVAYGPNHSELYPIHCGQDFLADDIATLLITGVDPHDRSMPRYGSCNFIQTEPGTTWLPHSEFKVDTQPGNPIYRGELINSGSFLIYSTPQFERTTLYNVTIGDKTYLLRSKPTINS